MTKHSHPITPPPELVQQWYDNMGPDPGPFESFAIAAARWGADQELEACCNYFEDRLRDGIAKDLRATRRPEPPSLKEQALAALQEAAYMADDSPPQGICSDQIDTIRRALEALPE